MLETLKADYEIRRLHATYTDALYRKDWVTLGACWAKGGVWHAFGRRTEGREEIVDWLSSLTSMFSLVWHFPQTTVLDIHDNTAEGRLYISEVTRDLQDVRRYAMGIYHDKYSRIDGRWVFAERFWNLLYLGPADFSAKFWDIPGFGQLSEGFDMSIENFPTLQQIQEELGL